MESNSCKVVRPPINLSYEVATKSLNLTISDFYHQKRLKGKNFIIKQKYMPKSFTNTSRKRRFNWELIKILKKAYMIFDKEDLKDHPNYDEWFLVLVGYFAINDGHNVYLLSYEVGYKKNGIDPEIIKISTDKLNVEDPLTFKLVTKSYSNGWCGRSESSRKKLYKDKKFIYSFNKKFRKEFFEAVLSNKKESSNLFKIERKFNEVTDLSFSEYKRSPFYKDKKHVYYETNVIKGADPKTFKVDKSFLKKKYQIRFREKHHLGRNGKRYFYKNLSQINIKSLCKHEGYLFDVGENELLFSNYYNLRYFEKYKQTMWDRIKNLFSGRPKSYGLDYNMKENKFCGEVDSDGFWDCIKKKLRFESFEQENLCNVFGYKKED